MKRACLILILLVLAAYAMAQNQPLTLTSPNGGESWALGSTHDITWTHANLAGSVNLMLIGSNSTTPQYTIATGIPVLQGVFHWTIPANLIPGSYYKVQIFMPSPSGMLIQDFSDAPFSLISGTDPPPPPQTYIQVTSPNGGEQWSIGTIQSITWAYGNLDGNVRITLVQGANTPQIVVAEAVPIASGVFNWSIPNTIPAGQYKVHVQWLGIPAVYWGDVSDGFFTINNGNPPPPPPLITVTAPNGGETWVAGTMHPITWQFNGNGGMVMIQLIGGPEMSPINIIAHNIPANQQFFEWLINPFQMPGDAYRVQINLIDPSGLIIGDISDAPFSIVSNNPPPQSITVTSPNGGEQWMKGTWHYITWDSDNQDGNVRIALIFGQQAPYRKLIIARNAPNSGSFHWRVPYRLRAGSFYKIAVKSIDGAMDVSDAFFSILAPTYNLKATPNPTRQSTSISFDADTPTTATLRIYNIKGQCVRTLFSDKPLSGKQSIIWDGRDAAGRRVSAGIYYARVISPEYNLMQKIIMLK